MFVKAFVWGWNGAECVDDAALLRELLVRGVDESLTQRRPMQESELPESARGEQTSRRLQLLQPALLLVRRPEEQKRFSNRLEI
jgi:hypothetical protein